MTKKTFLKPAAVVLLTVAALGGFAASASGQTSGSARNRVEKLEPPTPGQAKTDAVVWPMLMGLVIAGAALTVNLIPSKRGHQD